MLREEGRRTTNRKTTLPVRVGPIMIGGGNPIVIQSMTNTDTKDVAGTIGQISCLRSAGCDAVRLALYDLECVASLREIRKAIGEYPLIADIHYDYRIALGAIQAGIDKVRLNPGNIGEGWKVKEVAKAAKEKGIPLRVGVNSGSLEKEYGHLPIVEALVASALREVKLLEDAGMDRIVVAVKSSNVMDMVEASHRISNLVDYPLHLGVTEAGPLSVSLVKSTLGIGLLLSEGIGDTIRYSISGDSVKEVYAAKTLLTSAGLFTGPDIISCPTCARTCIDVEEYALTVIELTKTCSKPLKIAIMGCVVNGVGEGKNADLGIAGIPNGGAIFEKGKIVGQYPKSELFSAFEERVKRLAQENGGVTILQ